MISVVYSKYNYGIPDSEIQSIIDKICKRKYDCVHNTSNELFILACRAAVKTGKIDYLNIEFHINGQTYHLNAAGQFIEICPKDVLDNHNRYMEILTC